MIAVDWCCGYGGMTNGMKAAGFEVQGVDLEPSDRYPAVLVGGDVRQMDGSELPAATWDHFSPPCNRFSLARCNRATDPPTEADMDILKACLRIRDARASPFWSVENVRGALPWFKPLLGDPVFKHGPFYFWGNFPPFLVERSGLRKGIYGSKSPKTKAAGKQVRRSSDPRTNAMVPIEISRPMAEAIRASVQPLCNVEGQS